MKSKTSNTGFQSDLTTTTRDLTTAYRISILVAVIMTITAVVGLLYQTTIYPTDELLHSFVPIDVVNLVFGLPILLGSMWLARRGRLIGLLCWIALL